MEVELGVESDEVVEERYVLGSGRHEFLDGLCVCAAGISNRSRHSPFSAATSQLSHPIKSQLGLSIGPRIRRSCAAMEYILVLIKKLKKK